MNTDFSSVRLPDEILHQLSGIAKRFPKIAKFESEEISLKGLTKPEKLALTFFYIYGELDGAFTNLHLCIRDLQRLSVDPIAFGEGSPIDRFKLIMRMCFYEYARFEDIFGFYTLWLVRNKMMTKEQRKLLRSDFHDQIKPIIKGRNVLLHDSPSWKKWHTAEIALLQGADTFGMKIVDKEGKELTWLGQLGPMCERAIPLWSRITNEMTTSWSMLFAEAVNWFVTEGLLKKAKRPFPKSAQYLRQLQRQTAFRRQH